ncbi:Fur family ferric uptake transcriptional regulator [Celerinatantimonas diazotrophica]|uniref:Ferric uptake regulation protein n=2 Tax=Celerinatantimonas diazotrophica TaxID=412034 RepID=A0A4R1J8M3_9GAMM|nr:Fur family ferric uptake transcriptional regulator [Celerinatantimonas diazotrophica]CAG9295673.1 Ferric uptake regulation protein [Celerinatantimonas diazotrophica]
MSDPTTLLRQAGLKVTLPRLAILRCFMAQSHPHQSAELVYQSFLNSSQPIALATVYRVLEQFTQAGLLKRHYFDGKVAMFELNLHRQHAHLICNQCGEVIEFEDDIISDRLKQIAASHQLKIVDQTLYIYGECACQKHT